MNKKNITIDELAVIINKGFNGQMDYLKENFERIDERFETINEKFEKKKCGESTSTFFIL